MATKAETVYTSTPIQKYESSSSDRLPSQLTMMQNLNDHLVSYTDGMRCLENENARLKDLVESLTETADREIANTKQIYEEQLSEKRKLAEVLSLEKTQLEIDMKRVWEEKAELKQKYDQKNTEAQISGDTARLYMSKYNASVAEHKKTIVDAENMKLELTKLRKQFEEYKNNNRKETVARVELENSVRTLNEELKLKDQLHNGSFNEALLTHRQMDNSRIDEQYDSKFQESLQELRDQYEDQMRSNREEIESLYDSKIKNENTVERDNKAKLQYLASQIDAINARNVELEQNNLSLNNRIRDLQLRLNGEKARTAESEVEITRLCGEMTLQLEKYQDLMDTKVSLDLEIAAAGKLLSLPSNSGSVKRLSDTVRASSAAKRKRNGTFVYSYAATSSSTGDIEITELDPAMKCVKLHNKTENEVDLGGWQLILKAGGNETLYKFDCSSMVAGGADLIIWSSDSGVSASTGNIIMESQSWCVSQEMTSTLINGNGEEVATTERRRQQRLPLNRQIEQRSGPARKKCILM